MSKRGDRGLFSTNTEQRLRAGLKTDNTRPSPASYCVYLVLSRWWRADLNIIFLLDLCSFHCQSWDLVRIGDFITQRCKQHTRLLAFIIYLTQRRRRCHQKKQSRRARCDCCTAKIFIQTGGLHTQKVSPVGIYLYSLELLMRMPQWQRMAMHKAWKFKELERRETSSWMDPPQGSDPRTTSVWIVAQRIQQDIEDIHQWVSYTADFCEIGYTCSVCSNDPQWHPQFPRSPLSDFAFKNSEAKRHASSTRFNPGWSLKANLLGSR